MKAEMFSYLGGKKALFKSTTDNARNSSCQKKVKGAFGNLRSNAIESANRSLRKFTKNRGSFPIMKLCSSCCTWLYRIFQRSGAGRFVTGERRLINSQSCLKTGCQHIDREAIYSKFLTCPSFLFIVSFNLISRI